VTGAATAISFLRCVDRLYCGAFTGDLLADGSALHGPEHEGGVQAAEAE
jgi:hypothetical protein